ncbi:MAG TPA: hypothetical protein VJR50_15540 [Mycobacterium sp.]|nr:hypothetical protein [Mycobacterium sp.]
MKITGPIATLAAVAALGAGLWLVDVSKQPDAEPQPAAAIVTSAPATPAAPKTPASTPFAATEDFVADIPTKTGNLALEIRVVGDRARAYACDNEGIETWLSGSAVNGVLKLSSMDGRGQLDGRHQRDTVNGTLRIGEKGWTFTAVPGETSAF